MVGIDIVSISRITRIMGRHEKRFLERIFTREEVECMKKRKSFHETLAGRFAAKEAFMKAYGKSLPWKDIEVLSEKGRPFIRFCGKDYSGVSISHEKTYAVSLVMLK
ncbi:MAG TPA: holo-[acyl-carrier-protein] synthase [Deltaproteobacteria bacterium]|nr:holo-[acyl-carrier-protein] synthase [Deltaproteobacteria bacterium]